MASLSFDPAAHFYDATRGYPDDVALKIAHAIDEAAQATSQTAYLEIGVGTGRIAQPLASLGHTYTGVDISEKMLAQLETKLLAAGWQKRARTEYPWGSFTDEQTSLHPSVQRFERFEKSQTQPPSSLRLVVSDIEQLPFVDHSFDAVVAVHIFHLIDGWERSLQEVVRVLRSGGKLLQCWDAYDASAIGEVVNAQWRGMVQDLGGSTSRPGVSTHSVKHWLKERGFQTQDERALAWSQQVIPRQAIDYIAQRYWSSSWQIPDDIFAVSIERLWAWAHEYFGPQIDVPQVQERHFFISITQL
ncbi:MAG: class I SAM-dependent methyltransferase [Ktedonobacteraceae bacterium]|nr:class I SAM-dependent methyltransferase [Ktedonobacteraceae bacterium]